MRRQPTERVGVGFSGIFLDELKALGELRGWVAFSILGFAETSCRDKEARMDLLVHETDQIIDYVLRNRPCPPSE